LGNIQLYNRQTIIFFTDRFVYNLNADSKEYRQKLALPPNFFHIQEDRALIKLYQQRGIRKWTQISQLLTEEFGLLGRSPKNCRERYKNYLNP
jgi:predicted metal-binding protein